MAKYLELRRHTDNEGDVLTPDGVRAALEIGRRLAGGYHVLVSSGAQRATQTAACLLAGLAEEVPAGMVVEPRLRSQREDEWRAAYREAGSGELAAFRRVTPELVAQEASALAEGLRAVLDLVPEGGRALVVGHSPTNEAAVLGLTGEEIGSLGKGEGVLVVVEGDGFRVEGLP